MQKKIQCLLLIIFLSRSNIVLGMTKKNADFYSGAGYYKMNHMNNKISGHYFWEKLKIRPFDVNISDQLNLGTGFFVNGKMGCSGTDESSNHWQSLTGGLSLKLISSYWDIDFDFGGGQRSSFDKAKEGKYRSDQHDTFTYLASHLDWRYIRDHRKSRSVPKTCIDFEAVIPQKTHQSRSWEGVQLNPEPYNIRRIELSLEQWIYDHNITDTMRITPGIKLWFGRESNEDTNYYQIGPALMLSYKNKDFFSVSIFYKKLIDSEKDQWQGAFFFDIGNFFKVL
jgi:hypothetical protein